MFAMQMPQLVCFRPVEEVDYYVPMDNVSSETWEDIQQRGLIHCFRESGVSYVFSHALPQVAQENIQVFWSVRCTSGTEMGCALPPEPMVSVLERFGTPWSSTEERTAPARQQVRTGRIQVLAKHPWLRGHFEEEDDDTTRGIDGVSPQGPQQVAPVDELTDQQVEDVFLELKARRLELNLENMPNRDFRVRVLGGAWCKAHSGLSYDAFQGYVLASSPAAAWAGRYKIRKTSRYGVTVFGDGLASLLAHEWCRRCQHFYDVFERQDDPQYRYSEQDVGAFVVSLELLALLPTLAPGSLQAARVHDLVSFAPAV